MNTLLLLVLIAGAVWLLAAIVRANNGGVGPLLKAPEQPGVPIQSYTASQQRADGAGESLAIVYDTSRFTPPPQAPDLADVLDREFPNWRDD